MDNKPLKIKFLEAAQGPEAVKLLRQAFRLSERNARNFMDAVLAGNRFRGRKIAFGATLNGKLVGMVACERLICANDNSAEIMDLAVDEDYRGRGIGPQLMDKAETYIAREWLKGRFGSVRLKDATKRDNPHSQFYEKLGYEIDNNPGRLPCGNEPLMVKALNNAEPVALRA
ncbi:MAG TPA: GNAT family N-acetyltransferase [Patescibacteria group bacterium]|nr:GNAT family N-acetyltransferase [Patescibacteria group bacterium]